MWNYFSFTHKVFDERFSHAVNEMNNEGHRAVDGGQLRQTKILGDVKVDDSHCKVGAVYEISC